MSYTVAATLSEGREWAESAIRKALHDSAMQDSVILGEIKFEEGTDQDEGPVLIGEAEVICKQSGIVGDLTDEDLAKLRLITRKAHRMNYPTGPLLSDEECDDVINGVAPYTIEKLLGTVH